MSVVIKNPDRKKKTVTPNPPGTQRLSPACAAKTIRKLIARRPSSDGMCVLAARGTAITVVGTAAPAMRASDSGINGVARMVADIRCLVTGSRTDTYSCGRSGREQRRIEAFHVFGHPLGSEIRLDCAASVLTEFGAQRRRP